MRVIQIVQGKNLRFRQIDSLTTLEMIAGDVILKEGLTTFYCDSATINRRTNIMEAFGNIHINQNDSIHTYSQYLKYIGADRMAYLKKDVRLTDNKGTLFTQELEYDLKSSIGKYFKGGKVVNGKTTLTSVDGVYYADTRDVFFTKNVRLVDPKYDISGERLVYNTQTQMLNWDTTTYIKSKNGGDIYSTNGNYDLKKGKAFFGNRTIIKDSTRTYTADVSAYDEITGIAQLEGNAVIRDSLNGYTVLGGQIFLNKQDNSFLATRKPVLIFKGEGNDSTFIAADTLYSGIEKRDKYGNKIVVKNDTLKTTTVINVIDTARAVGISKDSSHADSSSQKKVDAVIVTSIKTDSSRIDSLLNKKGTDSLKITDTRRPEPPTKKAKVNPVAKTDSTNVVAIIKNDSITVVKKDSVLPPRPIVKVDSTKSDEPTDSMMIRFMKPKDTTQSREKIDIRNMLISPASDTLKKGDTMDVKVLKDTAIRFFQAFHHVRIFNDSVQSVCDSLFYSSEDSVFRLFYNPLVFSSNSQIAGDTIYMYTKNKKADRVYVFENGIIINETKEKLHNQVGGRTINGYFKDGTFDYMRVKGSPAESVYYPQDNDSAYVGLNRAKSDVIDVYFINKEVNKIKFINEVDGTLYPMRQIPEEQKFLKNHKWQDERRPKNKFELFE